MNDEHDLPAGLYSVYVVALAAEGGFARRNPGYRAGQPCDCADVTDLAVDMRFDQIMHGIKGKAFVRMYGIAQYA